MTQQDRELPCVRCERVFVSDKTPMAVDGYCMFCRPHIQVTCRRCGCHRTFASVALFDLHRSNRGEHGACIPPERVLTKDGERRLFFRDGMWRGPELTEEQRVKLAKVWGGESDDPIPA